MARIETTHLVDDLDGGQADETVELSLDRKPMELDLSAANAEKLRAALAPYIAVARRASPSTRPASASRRGSAGTDRAQNAEIREFARARGMMVGERGRIPSPVLEAWRESGGRAVAS